MTNISNKKSPGVNFINIKHTNFSYECRFGSFYYVHVTRKKLPKWHSYKKFARLMLMKLTPTVNYMYFGLLYDWAALAVRDNPITIFLSIPLLSLPLPLHRSSLQRILEVSVWSRLLWKIFFSLLLDVCPMSYRERQ